MLCRGKLPTVRLLGHCFIAFCCSMLACLCLGANVVHGRVVSPAVELRSSSPCSPSPCVKGLLYLNNNAVCYIESPQLFLFLCRSRGYFSYEFIWYGDDPNGCFFTCPSQDPKDCYTHSTSLGLCTRCCVAMVRCLGATHTATRTPLPKKMRRTRTLSATASSFTMGAGTSPSRTESLTVHTPSVTGSTSRTLSFTVLLSHATGSTISGTRSPSLSETASPTPSNTLTPTTSDSESWSLSWSNTLSPTADGTPSRSTLVTSSLSIVPSLSPASASTASRSLSPSLSKTASPTPSDTPTPTPTHFESGTLSPLPSGSVRVTSSISHPPSLSPTPGNTASNSHSLSGSPTATLPPRGTVSDATLSTLSTRISATPPAASHSGTAMGTGSVVVTPSLGKSVSGRSLSASNSRTSSWPSPAATRTRTISLKLLNLTKVGPFDDVPVAALWSNTTLPQLLVLIGGDAFLVSTPLVGAQCATFTGMGPATAPYAAGNLTLLILNHTAAAIKFLPQAALSLSHAESIEVHIQPSCMASARSPPLFNITVRPPPVPEPIVPQAVMKATKAIGSSSAVASGVIVAPTAATQASRTMLILEMSACEPSFDDLDFFQSPTQVRIGASTLAMHVGGAVMNHVLIAGMGAAMLAAAAVRAHYQHLELSACLTWVRFPSLLVVPMMLLLEPTAMCCCTLIFFAPAGLKVLAAVSLGLCAVAPAATWVYLSPSRFHAEYVESASAEEGRAESSWWSLLCARFSSRYKWRDASEAHTGFCRRNRLLFCDYRSKCSRFLCVEMAMCVATGILEGSQTGSGHCIGVMVSLAVCVFAYTLLLLLVRPYSEYLVLLFSVVMSLLQCVSASSMLVYTVFEVPAALDASQMVSVALLYLMLLTTLVSLYPRARMVHSWAVKRARQLCRREQRNIEPTLLASLLSVTDVENMAHLEAASEAVEELAPIPPVEEPQPPASPLDGPSENINESDEAPLLNVPVKSIEEPSLGHALLLPEKQEELLNRAALDWDVATGDCELRTEAGEVSPCCPATCTQRCGLTFQPPNECQETPPGAEEIL